MDTDGAEAQPVEGEPQVPSGRHGVLRYTLERLVLFVAVTAVLWLIGLRANLVLTAALGLVLSGFLALFLLNRSRDAASVSVTGVFKRINERIDQSSRAEDEQADQPPRAEDEQADQPPRAEDEPRA